MLEGIEKWKRMGPGYSKFIYLSEDQSKKVHSDLRNFKRQLGHLLK